MTPLERSPADMAATLLDLSSRLLARVRKNLSIAATTTPGAIDEHRGNAFATTPGQFRLLRLLLTRERSTMQELASLLDVAPPSVTGLIKRLLAQGYVQRVHDEADWRNIWIQLSAEGRQAVTDYDRRRIAVLQRRIERLNLDEQARLEAVFPVLCHLLEEEEA